MSRTKYHEALSAQKARIQRYLALDFPDYEIPADMDICCVFHRAQIESELVKAKRDGAISRQGWGYINLILLREDISFCDADQVVEDLEV